jgi:hypothetical protein
MKKIYKYNLQQSAKIIFVVLFCLNFALQKIVDNEANCGVIGSPESTCPYAFLDHANGRTIDHEVGEDGNHEDHVCLSCPCNLQLSVSWDLNLYHIYIQLNRIYISITKPEIKKLEQIKGYFRPPRHITT